MATNEGCKSYQCKADMPYAYIKQAVLMQVDVDFLRVDCDVVIPPSEFLKAGDRLGVHLWVEDTGHFFSYYVLDETDATNGLTVRMQKFSWNVYVGSKVQLSYFLDNTEISSLIQQYVVAELQ